MFPLSRRPRRSLADGAAVSAKVLKALLAFGVVGAVWWLATDALKLFNPLVLPSPVTVAQATWDLIFAPDLHLFSGGIYNGNLIGHALVSTGRVALGFATGVLLAVPLGVLIARSQALEPYVDPVLQLLRPIPPIAWTPLAILWFGIGLQAIVFLIVLGAFWPMLLNTISGIREVPRILGQAAASLGASRRQVLFTVILPAAIPFLFTGVRLAFGSAWITIVAAELIAASEGLGYLIMNARRILAAPDIVVGMLTIGVLGLAFDRVFRAIERRLYAR